MASILKYCSVSKLKKLAKNHDLICYGLTSWLKELATDKELLSSIKCIVDNNSYIWGTTAKLGTKSFTVMSPETIGRAISPKVLIVITASYQEQLFSQVCSYLNGAVITVYACPSEEDRMLMRFRKIYSLMPVKNIIVFRSGLQKYSEPWEYSDNARALFEFMIDNGYNEKYKLVWAVKYPEKFRFLTKNKNVFVISYDWEISKNPFHAMIYQYYIYCSKFFFFTETCKWLRFKRKEQTAVNLWHGCGIKGRKGKTEPTGPHYDYMVVNSPLYAKIHAKQYGCEEHQMLITGLPKQDWLFQKPEKSFSELLNAEIENSSKLIFWLPTFRQAQEGFDNLNEKRINNKTGIPLIDTVDTLIELNNILKQYDCHIIIKLHPLQNDLILEKTELSNICFITNDDMKRIGYPINRLLTYADAMISDYSSAAIDYALLDRPIAFTLDDLEQYESGREFNFDNIHDYLPGEEVYTFEELKEFIISVSKEQDNSKNKRKSVMQFLHTYTDGKACNRIIDHFGI